jgi:hypothetical protein
MLTYAEAEAEGIIRGQLGVVSALIDVLVDKGTLMGDEVDLIIRDTIARKLMAPEHDRRKQWQRVLANAATFQITRAMFASDERSFRSMCRALVERDGRGVNGVVQEIATNPKWHDATPVRRGFLSAAPS